MAEARIISIAPGNGKTDACGGAVIRQVAERVRFLRAKRRLSRRELSERSGISLRYLAQLEAGEGNISIGLLARVATALDQPMASFFETEADETEDAQRVASLFRHADAATRTRILELLDPQRLRELKGRRICLVGLRGAGKSTLGARIAARLDLPFIELNSAIERTAGMATAEIIALYGQEGYRQLEADTLDEIIAEHDSAIVAAAGGIVAQDATFERVLQRFHTIWIKALAGEHMDRVRAQGDMRPMAGNPQAMIQLRQILLAREAQYARADQQLDTSGRTVETSEADLMALIDGMDIFAPQGQARS